MHADNLSMNLKYVTFVFYRSLHFARVAVAEGVGFEPTVACTTPVFKTGLFVHSSTPPKKRWLELDCYYPFAGWILEAPCR